jgi:hypothetical protein
MEFQLEEQKKSLVDIFKERGIIIHTAPQTPEERAKAKLDHENRIIDSAYQRRRTRDAALNELLNKIK